MKKMMFVCLSLLVVASGCGKKKKPGTEKTAREKRLMSQADANKEIPLYTAQNENLLDEEALADFAFADDENPALAENAMPILDESNEADLYAENDSRRADFSFDTVHFAFNKNNIAQDQQPIVEKNVELAKKAVEEGKNVVVQGHTCQMGSATYNLALSQRRAEAVKNEMVRKGVDEEHVKTLGLGYESPLVWTDAADRETKIQELAPNRRAEVIIN